jgi:catechol 2,3-dioxygenase-like lactoylglutathione lyase family enzyme
MLQCLSVLRRLSLTIAMLVICIHVGNLQAADLTRHLATHVQSGDSSLVSNETFFGVEGSARLIVQNGINSDPETKVTSGSIVINGFEVLKPWDFTDATDQLEVPVQLKADQNNIEVRFACSYEEAKCETGATLKVRVQQVTDLEISWVGRIHYNTQVSSFAVSRPWYRDLGLTVSSTFPDTNTWEVAMGIGIQPPTEYDGSHGPELGGYLLHGELIALENAGGVFIDLIEFTIPRNNKPPYSKLNHVGMARAAMLTTNLDADYEYMTATMGVEFLSSPVTRSDGTRFAIFKDPDGTFYELQEIPIGGIPAPTFSATNIVQLGKVNVNVSDFERSREFYKMLGFKIGTPLAETESPEVAKAMGFDSPFVVKGELIRGHGTEIELVQWVEPFNPCSPYPMPVNHIGIHRMAYITTDLSGDVAKLKAEGVKFISDIAPCCDGPDSGTGIVAFYDPDGTVLELFGPVK